MSIFNESKSYRPFNYEWAIVAEKTHRIDSHWHEDEISLADDLRQYNSKDGLKTKSVSHADNKRILDKFLMIFTEMDKTVGTGYCKLLPHVHNNEIKTLLMTQAAREITHQRGYAMG